MLLQQSQTALIAGTAVEVQRYLGTAWYPGIVKRASNSTSSSSSSNCFDIDYSDGGVEAEVPRHLLRLRGAAAARPARTFKVGDAVEVKQEGTGGAWVNSTVASVNTDGTYSVTSEDGVSGCVRADMLRALSLSLKAVITSDGGSLGQSCILHRWCGNEYSEILSPTIGIDFNVRASVIMFQCLFVFTPVQRSSCYVCWIVTLEAAY
jgi:hypothetical protein